MPDDDDAITDNNNNNNYDDNTNNFKRLSGVGFLIPPICNQAIVC